LPKEQKNIIFRKAVFLKFNQKLGISFEAEIYFRKKGSLIIIPFDVLD